MIVAITGGTGFVGKRLVMKHLLLGDEVRFLTRNPKKLDSLVGAKGYLGDLSVNTIPVEFLDRVDILYHLAAELTNEDAMWVTNVIGTKNLLEAANGKVGRWIQLSSTGLYGRHLTGLISETSIVNPDNAYERSKLEADRLVLELWQGGDKSAILLRPSNVYGPDMPNQSLFQLIKIIDSGLFFFVGEKGAVMNYIHVDNVVKALVMCGTERLHARSNVFILSDQCTIERMVEIISLAFGKTSPILRLPKFLVNALAVVCERIPSVPLKKSRVDAITGRVVYSSDHIRESIGYCNELSIEEGLKELAICWKVSTLKSEQRLVKS